jgi:hypothetical protein
MLINELKGGYNNWIRYSPESLRADFDEYAKKEKSKWQGRAMTIGSRFPMFRNLAEFKAALDSAQIVNLDSLDNVGNLTYNSSIADLEDMVSGYVFPRDVKRIVSGFKSNAKLPLPIVVKGSKGTWILAGNTRSNVARIMGLVPKALLVDISH